MKKGMKAMKAHADDDAAPMKKAMKAMKAMKTSTPARGPVLCCAWLRSPGRPWHPHVGRPRCRSRGESGARGAPPTASHGGRRHAFCTTSRGVPRQQHHMV